MSTEKIFVHRPIARTDLYLPYLSTALSAYLPFVIKFIIYVQKEVHVGKDQEKAQSEKDSHSKNRGGKKTNNKTLTGVVMRLCWLQPKETKPQKSKTYTLSDPEIGCFSLQYHKQGSRVCKAGNQ